LAAAGERFDGDVVALRTVRRTAASTSQTLRIIWVMDFLGFGVGMGGFWAYLNGSGGGGGGGHWGGEGGEIPSMRGLSVGRVARIVGGYGRGVGKESMSLAECRGSGILEGCAIVARGGLAPLGGAPFGPNATAGRAGPD